MANFYKKLRKVAQAEKTNSDSDWIHVSFFTEKDGGDVVDGHGVEMFSFADETDLFEQIKKYRVREETND